MGGVANLNISCLDMSQTQRPNSREDSPVQTARGSECVLGTDALMGSCEDQNVSCQTALHSNKMNPQLENEANVHHMTIRLEKLEVFMTSHNVVQLSLQHQTPNVINETKENLKLN